MFRMFRKENADLSLMLTRFALGGVFLWFGIDKLVHPELWFGYVPGWAEGLMPFGLKAGMVLLGMVEAVIGLLFVAGRALQVASAAAWLMLLGIMLTQGANELAVRDSALLAMAAAVFVSANGRARRPLSRAWVEAVTLVTVLAIFVAGVQYLRSGS